MAEIIVNIPFSEYINSKKVRSPIGMRITQRFCIQGNCSAHYETACLGIDKDGNRMLRLYYDHRLMDPQADESMELLRKNNLKLIEENCLFTNGKVRS
ncbi:MAG: hypothetical protein US53_C0052G0010 [Candidatus Woesebacteria bacterium GW2011_GWA1_37_7]|uniref:Uncharacterized protein n=1 Tax=Candidatus Woesebacteria bacterium GW2011_GWA1_37_7 TaxID=1618545 RepID=A0A0G0H2P0_9BACT|nr:MAG: hypothetical protein US53_C0052G0010 [Candidatus Woesebacteria bacterium GW2011_GWA1_37_7]